VSRVTIWLAHYDQVRVEPLIDLDAQVLQPRPLQDRAVGAGAISATRKTTNCTVFLKVIVGRL
jgi:hypothetical protein